MLSKEKWLPKLASGLEPSDIYDHITERWGVVVESDQEHWIIAPSNLLDQQDVGLICATHNNALDGERPISISAVINEGLEPFIEMTLGTETIQMTIPQARLHLRVIQEETESAIAEAMLVKLFDEQLGFDGAVAALRKFREERARFNSVVLDERFASEHSGR